MNIWSPLKSKVQKRRKGDRTDEGASKAKQRFARKFWGRKIVGRPTNSVLEKKNLIDHIQQWCGEAEAHKLVWATREEHKCGGCLGGKSNALIQLPRGWKKQGGKYPGPTQHGGENHIWGGHGPQNAFRRVVEEDIKKRQGLQPQQRKEENHLKLRKARKVRVFWRERGLPELLAKNLGVLPQITPMGRFSKKSVVHPPRNPRFSPHPRFWRRQGQKASTS